MGFSFHDSISGHSGLRGLKSEEATCPILPARVLEIVGVDKMAVAKSILRHYRPTSDHTDRILPKSAIARIDMQSSTACRSRVFGVK